MISYEYVCEQCEITCEHQTRDSTSSPPLCVVCGEPMKQKYSLAAVSFKGDGFYKTDKDNHVG